MRFLNNFNKSVSCVTKKKHGRSWQGCAFPVDQLQKCSPDCVCSVRHVAHSINGAHQRCWRQINLQRSGKFTCSLLLFSQHSFIFSARVSPGDVRKNADKHNFVQSPCWRMLCCFFAGRDLQMIVAIAEMYKLILSAFAMHREGKWKKEKNNRIFCTAA